MIPGMRLPFLHSEGWSSRVAARLSRRVRKRQEKTEVTELELNKYKNVLNAKLAELGQLVRNRDGIAIQTSPDALDEVQYAAERELAIRNLDRDSSQFRKVRAALLRIEEGSFGVCLHCEEDISPKRLAAVPFTAYCIVCQELADRCLHEGAENLDELLTPA